MGEIALTTKVGGRLTPAATVAHTAPANGIVRSIFVSAGQYVRAGDRLFNVERDDLSGSYVPAVVTARVSGMVSAIAVKPNGAIKNGEAGVSIIDPGVLYLNALVSDKDANALREGVPVTATAPNGQVLQGSIKSRPPEPDYATGLFTVGFEFPNVPATLLGQFATVDLPLGRLRGIFLPQDALMRMYGRYQVWIIDSEQKLQERRVTIGAIYGTQVEIKEGLAVGETILLKRTGRERAGAPVEVQPQAQTGSPQAQTASPQAPAQAATQAATQGQNPAQTQQQTRPAAQTAPQRQ